jgi:hypothetical protein
MSRVLAALSLTATLVAAAVPTAASAGCGNCYAPPPCVSCVRHYVVPPQYRTIDETVMVAPARHIPHYTAPRYRTVMVPKTVMVAPAGVHYEEIPPQYRTVQRTVMVAPARTYVARPRCNSCGW